MGTAKMNRIFWSTVALEAVAVCYVQFLLLSRSGSNLFDKITGLVAGGLAILLVAASLVYWNTQSRGIHQFLLILVAAPLAAAAVWGAVHGAGAVKRHRIDQYNDGRLVAFPRDTALSRFVLAVYELDSGKVRDLSKEVDINSVSVLRNYTPLKVAVERAVEAEEKPEGPGRSLEMVRLLLSLGAKPNSGLRAACHQSSRSDAVRLLLDAGADPNNNEPDGTGSPAYFGCFSSRGEAAGIENLRLMRDKGADFRLKGDFMPPVPMAASNGRWETVVYLHESGAPLLDDRDGGWMASRVAADLAEAKQKGLEPSEGLRRVAELLKE
jgi:hypothetical protein